LRVKVTSFDVSVAARSLSAITEEIDSFMSGVSVVIPTYNNGPFIRDSISSVLAQSVLPDEIIVVDDGSTDGTDEIVAPYVSTNFRYVRQRHQGVSTARNLGLDRAQGRYIAFLDADDMWRPSMLECQLRLMQSGPELVCCFGNFVRFVHDTHEVLPDQFQYFPELSTTPFLVAPDGVSRIIKGNAFASLVQWGDFPAFMLTMLFRAETISGLRFDERLVRCQDANFVLRVCMRGATGYTSEVLADVRRHGSNATSDVGLMALDKLKALECLGEDPLASQWTEQLNARLIRARFDAANALLRRKRWAEARVQLLQAIRSPGRVKRKVKGLLRSGLVAVQSL
jgi:glycosyltransferase involved in cell wall biosynthesis